MHAHACVCHSGSTSDRTLLAWKCQVHAGAYQALATKEYGNKEWDKWIISCITRFSLTMDSVNRLYHSWSHGCDRQRLLPSSTVVISAPFSVQPPSFLCSLFPHCPHRWKYYTSWKKQDWDRDWHTSWNTCVALSMNCSVRWEWADLRHLIIMWWLKLLLFSVCVCVCVCTEVWVCVVVGACIL